MPYFIIKKLPYDLTSNSGLALVGQYTKRLEISASIHRKFPVGTGGIKKSDILKFYLGFLVNRAWRHTARRVQNLFAASAHRRRYAQELAPLAKTVYGGTRMMVRGFWSMVADKIEKI